MKAVQFTPAPLLMAFDLLYYDRHDLSARPLRNRRDQLPVRRLAPGGLEAWKPVVQRGYEGYVAKDEASVYESVPTRRWSKVKQNGWTVAEDGWRRRISVTPPAH